MIVAVTYYEVRCDQPECDRTTGTTSGSEHSAWSDPGTARDDWTNGDGVVLDDGRAFCEEHAVGKVCSYCDHQGDDLVDDDGEFICPACAREAATEAAAAAGA